MISFNRLYWKDLYETYSFAISLPCSSSRLRLVYSLGQPLSLSQSGGSSKRIKLSSFGSTLQTRSTRGFFKSNGAGLKNYFQQVIKITLEPSHMLISECTASQRCNSNNPLPHSHTHIHTYTHTHTHTHTHIHAENRTKLKKVSDLNNRLRHSTPPQMYRLFDSLISN